MIITVINLFFIVIVLRFIYNYKSKKVSTTVTNLPSKHKSKKSKQKNIVIESETIVPIVPTKNKFLFPEDGLGTLEQNVVYNSIIFQSKITDNNLESSELVIIPAQQEEQK